MKTNSMKIKAVAFSLAALTAFGVAAPYAGPGKADASIKTVSMMSGNDDLYREMMERALDKYKNGNGLSGGTNRGDSGAGNTETNDAIDEANNDASLDEYLQSIAPKDKKTLLVDKGTGTSVEANSEVKEGSNKDFYIIRRTKESVNDMTADLGTLGANINGIYPGAVVHADTNLVDGHPTVISESDLKRKPVTVGIDINGNTQEPITVENPTQMKVMSAINKQVGVNEDGSYKLGPWEKLLDETTGNKERYFKGKYAEFGFSFDISWGTDWPYSDVFWTVDNGAAKEIKIEWGGGVRTAWIEITVDDKKVVDDTNCSSHSEYNFGCLYNVIQNRS